MFNPSWECGQDKAYSTSAIPGKFRVVMPANHVRYVRPTRPTRKTK